MSIRDYSMSTQLRFDFLGSVELSPTARLVGELLNRTRPQHGEAWLSNKTIAAKIGRSIRTVQLALKELAQADLIRVCKDYALKTRRRIHLLWRGDSTAKDPSVGAKNCADSAQEIAPSSAIPPHPPIEDLTELKREIDDDVLSSSSSPSFSPTNQTAGKPNDEELTQATEKAQELFPGQSLRGRVEAEARRCAAFGGGLGWVAQALDVAQAASAETWGFVVGVLRNWREEGGPPPPPPSPEELKARLAENDRLAIERLRAMGIDV